MRGLSAELTVVLNEYHDRYRIERVKMAELGEETWDHADEFLLPIGPATGRVLHDLILAGRYRTILDIGTSYGYSSLWFAHAARQIGGRVISVDTVAAKQDYARAQLERAGLDSFVEFVTGDIRDVLNDSRETYDFVLIDVLWKHLYPICYDLVCPRLRPGSIIAADNMTFPDRKAGAAYRDLVVADGKCTTMLLPIGSGVELSVYGSSPVANIPLAA